MKLEKKEKWPIEGTIGVAFERPLIP